MLRETLARLSRSIKRELQTWEATLALALELALLLMLPREVPPANLSTYVDRLLAGERFNFVAWELQAIWGKLTHTLVAPQRYMDETARSSFLLDYLTVVAHIQALEQELQRIYSDPQVQDKEPASHELLLMLDILRHGEDARQLIAEAILEEQAYSVLASEGFGALGYIVPPVGVHFTSVPTLLVISPRERIERVYSAELHHGLDAAQREAIEEEIDAAQNVSSLVVDVGGMSSYPAMVMESSSIVWVTDVTVHEWMHHYLSLRPLGRHYGCSPETRTINETVASIVGREAGRLILARYYPNFLPQEPSATAQSQPEGNTPPEKPAFDFNLEMRKTRVQVDALLAEGKIEEAEEYMEMRRREFVAHNYHIRKLNQAYFAFYGAYADEPGAAGEDPVGPAVQKLRALTPDLYTFVRRVASVTRLSELEALIKELESQAGDQQPSGHGQPSPGPPHSLDDRSGRGSP
ncbi:MAG: tellurite resistance TerB family protein [Anaerolineae bacterium]|nr:tellurite resistance TerB family protein [Anaerolineae bacterium]